MIQFLSFGGARRELKLWYKIRKGKNGINEEQKGMLEGEFLSGSKKTAEGSSDRSVSYSSLLLHFIYCGT